MSSGPVILRNLRDEGGVRRLSASLSEAGDLLIEGQDLGAGVERVFGSGIREYEWIWTIGAESVPLLLDAMKHAGHVLDALVEQFSDDKADSLKPFLDDNGVKYEAWSRLGE